MAFGCGRVLLVLRDGLVITSVARSALTLAAGHDSRTHSGAGFLERRVRLARSRMTADPGAPSGWDSSETPISATIGRFKCGVSYMGQRPAMVPARSASHI